MRGDCGLKRMYGVRDSFARGRQWVLFMDADDLISSRLHRMADLEHHDAVVFGMGYSWIMGSACFSACHGSTRYAGHRS